MGRKIIPFPVEPEHLWVLYFASESAAARVMLALGFLLLIGATLIADGFGFHFPKSYIYADLAFSGAAEGLDMPAKRRRKQPPE